MGHYRSYNVILFTIHVYIYKNMFRSRSSDNFGEKLRKLDNKYDAIFSKFKKMAKNLSSPTTIEIESYKLAHMFIILFSRILM